MVIGLYSNLISPELLILYTITDGVGGNTEVNSSFTVSPVNEMGVRTSGNVGKQYISGMPH